MPAPNRYETMTYNRCGKWGLKLPEISLGGWQTVGGYEQQEEAQRVFFRAFDLGITHFDFANNYGVPPGNGETVGGKILAQLPRDELIISSKAGYRMWPGPYGEWGSRKYLVASCDQSLKRLGVDYVDIFYSHRFDPDTPIEETMGALDHAVRSGRALYAGISSYGPERTREAVEILRQVQRADKGTQRRPIGAVEVRGARDPLRTRTDLGAWGGLEREREAGPGPRF